MREPSTGVMLWQGTNGSTVVPHKKAPQMIRLTGLALAAAVSALASMTSAATPAPAIAPASVDVGKKSPADCATTAVAKPESDGDGVAKPAQPTAPAPAPSLTDDRQLAPLDGSGGDKPADQAHQLAQTACTPT